MAHTALTCRADFDYALETDGQFVLVYAYTGEVTQQAEEYAERYKNTTDAYKVDVDKYPTAREFFQVTVTPTIMVYKAGKQLIKMEKVNPESMRQIADMLSSP